MLNLRVLMVFICINSDVWAQECDFSRLPSTPDENYFINDDATVTEVESGLTWMRCAIGQNWNGATCTGNAKAFSWKQAFKQQDHINQGQGYADLYNWRLPTLPELATIVERQCDFPRINLKIFPATPAAAFWTANHKKGREQQAFALDFKKDGLQVFSYKEMLYVRLVSGRN